MTTHALSVTICPTCQEAPRTFRGDLRVATLAIVIEDNNQLRAALGKVDAIRNSIIGAQAVNWSEHIYPLVAALEEAGYKGQPYESARANIGTLIERNEKLEAAVRALGKCRRCNGDGEYLPTCFRCDDSTDDHECPGPRACTDCEQTGLAKVARDALATHRVSNGEGSGGEKC